MMFPLARLRKRPASRIMPPQLAQLLQLIMNDSHSRDENFPSGESPFIETADDRSPSAEARPGGLSLVCIVIIVLASLGLLTGCLGLASQASQARVQQAMAAMQAGNQPMAKLQQGYNDRVMAITDRYRWATLPLMIAKMAVEVGLLAGAIFCLRLDRRGAAWLQAGLVSAIVVEALHPGRDRPLARVGRAGKYAMKPRRLTE